MRRVTAAAGADQRLGVSLSKRLRARGLLHVNIEGRMRLCRGNTAAARLARLNFEQVREPMLAAGHLTIEQFNADIAQLDDEEYSGVRRFCGRLRGSARPASRHDDASRAPTIVGHLR